MVINASFWQGKKVLVTGHTGFKGSWLSLWLKLLGVELFGYSQPPPTKPNLFELTRLAQDMVSIQGDVRDLDHLTGVIADYKPEIIFHLAAQPIVRESYLNPVETYATNIMGTVNLLEAVRKTNTIKALVNITSDKCYQNKEWVWGYRENEPMGGYDPYSSSKGCAELVTSAYRSSFFNPQDYDKHGVAIASARAGNVIGGGDWAKDRLVPDIIRSILSKETIYIRYPNAIRPWQHVLDPLNGYLTLAEHLYNDGVKFAQPWNFGPNDSDIKPVSWIVEQLISLWDQDISWENAQSQVHEANFLKLDCSKAKSLLGWKPKLNLKTSLVWIIKWVKAFQAGDDLHQFTQQQIIDFMDIK